MYRLSDTGINFNPTPGGLPIFGTLQDLVNAVGYLAIVLCLVAAVLGGLNWALGSGSANIAAAAKGRKMVVGAIVGALVIGASTRLVDFFYTTGQHLH